MTNSAPAPEWATRQKAERAETKAAHLVALIQMRDQLNTVNKSKLSRELGISRWTLDRYLASLPEIEQRVAAIQRAIANMTTTA
jgi:hypothetical protein